jgi:hypothetical protein
MEISSRKISDIILEVVPFRNNASTGWFVGKCSLCNDYKERAGFKIENDKIFYNCWNCSTSSSFSENDHSISKTFRKILKAYNIPDEDISRAVNSGFFLKKNEKESISLKDLSGPFLQTPEVNLPPKSFKIGSTDKFIEYQEKLLSYLISRKVDVFKYPFYFSLEEKYLNRVIVPFYRNGKLIYWQARSINREEKQRFLNCPAKRDAVIFNFDRLFDSTRIPLIVSEGIFNALAYNGISLIGSKLNESKIHFLSKSPRQLLFVIDKDKNGKSLAYSVLSNGWEITFTPDGTKDINDSIVKYGKIWTAKQLIENKPKDINEAELMINTYCY